jgi:threonine/homoserine/homoserine lactone efflux protein
VLGHVLLGLSLGFGAAIQPGPLQALLVSRTLTFGWRRALAACFAPLLSDGPIALVAVLALGRLAPAAQQALRACGGALLLAVAVSTYGQWRRPATVPSHGDVPRTLAQAVGVNLLNPNPYLAWALVLGPLVVGAWSQRPAFAVGFVVALYATMVATLAAFVWLTGTARFLTAATQRRLVGLSVLILGGLGVALLAAGLRGLAAAAGG